MAVKMRSIFNRHPRTLVIIIAAFISLYLFFPLPIGVLQSANYTAYILKDDRLSTRIAHAEEEYAGVVRSRREMVKKYGPEARDIELFPPDKTPWPPYTVWSFFPAAFNCPHEVLRLGTLADGGKWVCGISRLLSASPSGPSPNSENSPPDDADDDADLPPVTANSPRPCVIYSIGLGYDSSFEADLLARAPHCRVWGYDPDPRVKGGWGWSSGVGRGVKARAGFKPWSLVGADGEGDGERYTLERLMEMNGHTHIDILKIDLEGREFDALRTLLRPYIASGKSLPFGQLLLEVHVWDRSFSELLAWWELLEAAGLRPFWTQPNLVYQNYNKKKTAELAEFSFLNIKGDNIFIADPTSTGSV